MICSSVCLETVMAEGQFALERKRSLGLKPKSGKAYGPVSLSLVCLLCKHFMKML